MSKIPKNPEEIFVDFKEDLKNIYGENLLSISLFGSGARGEYIPQKSDINFLVVLKDNTPSELVKYKKIIKKWNKRNVAIPLFLTNDYIKSSQDTFPIEFLEMHSAYKTVYGTDVLSDLNFSNKDLRHQLERELKSKLLHLRQEFLRHSGKLKKLVELIHLSIPVFAPLFRTMLFLNGETLTFKRDELFKKISEKYELDKNFFEKILKISNGEKKIEKDKINEIFDLYVEELDKLSEIVDKLDIKSD